MKLFLPVSLQQQIAAQARAAFPRECCGLLEGRIETGTARVSAIHAAKNLSDEHDRFEIDPRDHLRAQAIARANGNAIAGCYHSHPNGRPVPSGRDGDSDDGFIWLIAAIRDGEVGLFAFRRTGGGWQRAEIAETAAKSGPDGLA